ncbi:MAG: HAMP domain-containing protein [bacterium]
MKIGVKLIVGFCGVATFVAFVGLVSMISIKKIGNSTDIILEEKVSISDHSMEAKTAMVAQKASAEEYMGLKSPKKTAQLRKAFKTHMEEFDALERLLSKEVVAKHEDFCEKAIGKGNMFDQKDEALSLIEATEEKMALVDEYSEKGDEVMDKVEEIASEDMEYAMNNADSTQGKSNLLITMFTIISFILALGIGFFIGRGISVPLGRAVEVADAIAAGDLEQKIDINRSDEIGHLGKSMAVMVKNLKNQRSEIEKNVSDLNQILNNVADASNQISAGSQ